MSEYIIYCMLSSELCTMCVTIFVHVHGSLVNSLIFSLSNLSKNTV